VVLSPGFSVHRHTLTNLAEELPSRRYVVATVDHAYESVGTAFPGGPAAADQRHLDCVARVIAAVDSSTREGTVVTVTAIARRAKVSRTFLHDPAQADLLQRIRELAATPAAAPPSHQQRNR
jgi:hypothetical protein